MRKFLLVVIFCAAILHFVLLYIAQISDNGISTRSLRNQGNPHALQSKMLTSQRALQVSNKDKKDDAIIESCFNQNFRARLQLPKVHPFLCSDYVKQANVEGSRKMDLPYGIRNGDRYFRIVFSKLRNCELTPHIKVPCKKCVVVGNGGILRNKTLGKKIDSYDVIIRMNDAPVVAFEKDVGRKTTFRFCYPESIFSDPLHYDPNSTIVLLAFKPHDVKWLAELLLHKRASSYGFWRKPALKMMYEPGQIRILNPTILRKVAHGLLRFPVRFPKKEKPKHPTTGIIAITFALHVCNEVHIAGFKYNLTSYNSSLHYYGNETMYAMAKTQYHDITAEQLLLKDLMEKKTIVNLTPD